MRACASVRLELARYAESECGPAEALEVARHLTRCTGCRIVLARERRLLELLGELDDPLFVGDDLLERLRDRLPARPPARRPAARKKALRLLGLAVGCGAAVRALCEAIGQGWGGFGPGSLPAGYGPEAGEALARGLGGATRFLLEIAAQLSAAGRVHLDGLASPAWAVAALFGSAAAAGSCLIALGIAARTLLPRPSRDQAEPSPP